MSCRKFFSFFSRDKQPCMELPNQYSLVTFHLEDRSLPHGQDWWCSWYLMVLLDPLLPGLPLVCGAGVGVDVVRIDIKRNQAKGFE